MLPLLLLGLYGGCLLFVLIFSLVQLHLTHLAQRAYRVLPPVPLGIVDDQA